MCDERVQLRQEYIVQLAALNHDMRVFVATGRSPEPLRDRYGASHAAWLRYKRHLDLHGCRAQTGAAPSAPFAAA